MQEMSVPSIWRQADLFLLMTIKSQFLEFLAIATILCVLSFFAREYGTRSHRSFWGEVSQRSGSSR
jgi:hypothetical protein